MAIQHGALPGTAPRTPRPANCPATTIACLLIIDPGCRPVPTRFTVPLVQLAVVAAVLLTAAVVGATPAPGVADGTPATGEHP